jgi:hypothetical protein
MSHRWKGNMVEFEIRLFVAYDKALVSLQYETLTVVGGDVEAFSSRGARRPAVLA